VVSFRPVMLASGLDFASAVQPLSEPTLAHYKAAVIAFASQSQAVPRPRKGTIPPASRSAI
jgi:hypothetical protein